MNIFVNQVESECAFRMVGSKYIFDSLNDHLAYLWISSGESKTLELTKNCFLPLTVFAKACVSL